MSVDGDRYSYVHFADTEQELAEAEEGEFLTRLYQGEVNFKTDPYWLAHRGEEWLIGELRRLHAPKWLPAKRKAAFAVHPWRKIVHRVDHLWSMHKGGRVIYQATWLCSASGAENIVLISDAEKFGGVCDYCQSVFEGPVVYRCFDAKNRLLYIGSASKWHPRMKAHEKSTPWWPDVACVEKERHASVIAARHAEVLAIADENPHYNKVGKPLRKPGT